jgi:divalent metal cation (Fe/Co/Zn/Cd) transporter
MVDTGNEALLALSSAPRPASAERPFGHGRELYFWSFIVALLIFTLGAVVAVLEGVFRILDPRSVEDVHVVYIVIGLAFLFEGASWWFALRAIGGAKTPDDYLEAFRRSKDPHRSWCYSRTALPCLGWWSPLSAPGPPPLGICLSSMVSHP